MGRKRNDGKKELKGGERNNKDRNEEENPLLLFRRNWWKRCVTRLENKRSTKIYNVYLTRFDKRWAIYWSERDSRRKETRKTWSSEEKYSSLHEDQKGVLKMWKT